MGGATRELPHPLVVSTVSIHAPRGGSDHIDAPIYRQNTGFNPRFPWGERPHSAHDIHPRHHVSIHASRGGSDLRLAERCCNGRVSIHASRGGSDAVSSMPTRHRTRGFQSTLPVGGATEIAGYLGIEYDGFNPRFPWGERLRMYSISGYLAKFQSTLPVGGATKKAASRCFTRCCFNPRFPWGERRYRRNRPAAGSMFQSTLPVGGATINWRLMFVLSSFNPRFPWGERHTTSCVPLEYLMFQSTLPVGGATQC